ncbi:MAG: cytochrome c oxidase subunit II [Lysobacter sp.]|nr:cytochrome c oxidase subunit II [Lysobacter sp.]MDQ3268853.1 cytochrome c oxidase subunit II [Pseudomonadota bacterium]
MSYIPPLRKRLLRATAPLATCAVAACSGVQSTLDPAGPSAAAIAQTWWVMAVGAAVILTLVMVLLFYTLSDRDGSSRRTPGVGLIFVGGLLLPSFTLIALLAYGTVVSRKVVAMEAPAALVVEVVGRRFNWDFRYLADGDAPATSTTDVLVLPRGRNVEFRVTSADVIHSFWIPRLGGKIDAIPGRINVLRLRADEGGPISGQCAEFCGLEHAHMRFDVLALAPAEFDRWLADGGRQPPPRARAEVPRPQEASR